ncbi:winged helix-turn-helix domain-containing tetratricopeptide repeat protein [Stakelama marina]|uniref:Winged helix-turn-helix domain-containing protein n=1 Tax=Stakelama marina TaxID=2826939 RepID=A0A8T4IG45_9SPHN|nr:winged helix-turn-helix domain-containing protein [Stakelama marina]MBR0552045.1 winged helix-turn-helix domain-containing protein [Stakelama marina]
MIVAGSDRTSKSVGPKGAPAVASVRFRVGAFTVDPASNLLEYAGAAHPVEPLVMDVLCLLAQRAGDTVSRDELIEHVWFFNPYADESLTRAISLLRRIFRQDLHAGHYIETFWKRGYKLTAPVTPLSTTSHARALCHVHAREDEFAVAVLPFRRQSMEEHDIYLADGLTRDLTMLLSRVPRLRVAAYSSAQTVREGTDRAPVISDQLDVRYLVSGSLARQGENFQLRVALMDGVDDAQLWAQRIDARLDQFYSVQDKIVLDVSTSLSSALHLSHAATLQNRRPFQLNAYELVQRAEALRLNYNGETAHEIVMLLEQALVLDPEDGAVHAALAVQHTQNVTSKFCDAPTETFSLAKRHIDMGLALSPHDPDVLAAAGITATMMGNSRLAVRHLRSALELDPNNAHTLAVLGWQQCWLTGEEEGLRMIETAEKRAPHHPRYSVWAHYRGNCEIRLGRAEEAIEAYENGEARNPGYSLNLVTLAAAQAVAGRTNDALATLIRLRTIAPDYTLTDYNALARRMVYWFGEDLTRKEVFSAISEVWHSLPKA